MHLAEDAAAVLDAPPVTRIGAVLLPAERLLGALIGAAAAVLVVAEIVVLFSGVVARYVFHRPIIWTDELAGILFLWLAMLGAVLPSNVASTCA